MAQRTQRVRDAARPIFYTSRLLDARASADTVRTEPSALRQGAAGRILDEHSQLTPTMFMTLAHSLPRRIGENTPAVPYRHSEI